ncbi:MAG TPA: DUF2089 domain-containing protein [Acholeplasmataceae bacterium]|nr:DUF2089 domain-containing protein [Acholeplasmataceae bacterium]
MNKKAYPLITKDPVSGKPLQVTRLENFESGIVIEGNFNLSKFNYLKEEQRYFIEIFIKNRGNIKQVEKEMNISYPTVKKMLDDVILGLGYNVDGEDEEVSETNVKSEILKAVEKGLLSVEEAIAKLKK